MRRRPFRVYTDLTNFAREALPCNDSAMTAHPLPSLSAAAPPAVLPPYDWPPRVAGTGTDPSCLRPPWVPLGQQLCLSGLGSEGEMSFEQIEAVMHDGWSRAAANCNGRTASAAQRSECATHADVVVVRSLASLLADSGCDRPVEDRIEGPGSFRRPHAAYWSRLRLHVEQLAPARRRPPLVVVHYDWAWQEPYTDMMLHTLSEQPLDFVQRVVIVTFENPLELPSRPHNQLVFRELGVAPRFVIVPFTVLTDGVLSSAPAASEGGESAESAAAAVAAVREPRLKREGPHRDTLRRPIIALFMGRPLASLDGARVKVVDLMRAAGAVCDSPRSKWNKDDTVVCALCREPRECATLLRSSKRLCHDGWAPEKGVQCAHRTFALAASATFCIETNCDSLIRSHLYVSMMSGCVPVIFDGLGPHYTASEPGCPLGAACATAYERPTQWAWRQEALLALLNGAVEGGQSIAQRANYSSFTLTYSSPKLMRGELDDLVTNLVALATRPAQRPQLRSLQHALRQAAPLMRFSNPKVDRPCAGNEPCDAFSVAAAMVQGLARARDPRSSAWPPQTLRLGG